MKMLKNCLGAFFCLLLLNGSLMAQKKFLKEADNNFKLSHYFMAIDLYKKAYVDAKPAEKARIIFQQAECYRNINDLKNAEVWYDKAIKINYPDPKALLYLADAKKALGKYDEALAVYNNYKKAVPNDPRGENGAKSCELSAKWKENPTRYKVENLAQVNSKQLDFSPAFADRKFTTLYFTSTREGVTGDKIDMGYGQNFSDIFETKLDKNGKWSTPQPLPDPVNTGANDGSCVVSRKGNMMFFTRCPNENHKAKPCDIYFTVKKGMVWDDPKIIPFGADTTGNNGQLIEFRHPALSVDEQTLVFASNMKGGFGGFDLWYSVFNKDKNEWGAPVNLGPTINTPGNEVFPFIRDNGDLYFSSDGHLGMGGLDIFKATKTGDNQWGEVTNLQSPINSAADDFGIIFEGTKDRGYFASNRDGGKGGDDLYQFNLPALLYTIEGVLTDCKYKETIEGVTMKLVGSDGTSVETKTDKLGYYKFAENGEKRYVNENTTYQLTTVVPNELKTPEAKRGFLASSVKVKETTVGVNESKIFKHDFCLTPIELEIRFPEVQYELGKAELRPEAKDSLNYLVEVLQDNPTFVIELSAHTDSRGNATLNQKLSEARAQACVDYIASKGIALARLRGAGYGKTRLKISDAEIAKMKTKEEQEAAHQKNRRTVFTVLSKDFSDPDAKAVTTAPAPAPAVAPATTPAAAPAATPATNSKDQKKLGADKK